jgi:hypothetical protein
VTDPRADRSGDAVSTTRDDGQGDVRHAGDVVEGEVGSAWLKEPSQVEQEGQRPDEATLPEASIDPTGERDSDQADSSV